MEIITIHGIGFNFDEPNTFGPWLSEKLRSYGTLTNCHMPLGDELTFENWESVLNNFKDKLNENTTIVAHSLGTLFVLIYLNKHNKKIKNLISIGAGYNPEYLKNDTYKDFVPSIEDFEYCKRNIQNKFMVFSEKDRFFSEKHQQDYINFLGAKPIYIPGQGHFGRTEGVTKIPKVIELMEELSK